MNDLKLLPTALCLASGPFAYKEFPARIFFDNGANVSFVTKSLSERLRLEPIFVEEATVRGIGSIRLSKRWRTVELDIASVCGSWELKVQALEIDELSPHHPVPFKLEACYPSVCPQGEFMADSTPRDLAKVDLLLGQDNLWSVFTQRLIRPTETHASIDGPVFHPTFLGIVAEGRIRREFFPKLAELTDAYSGAPDRNLDEVWIPNNAITVQTANAELDKRLEQFWKLDHIGIQNSDSKLRPDEQCAIEFFQQTVRFDNGRYTVALLFRDDHPPLQNNYHSAMKRLVSTERALAKSNVKKLAYEAEMQGYVDRGDVETCDLIVQNDPAKRVFYLPHSAVIREDKSTTKCRVVFDGSAKGPGKVSLNDCLMKGPADNTDLMGILVRFRMYGIAISADIAKMYLQINVREEDRDVLRFLWREKGEVKCRRFTKVAFGITDSSFLATECCKLHANSFREKYPEAASKVTTDRWVDDLITGCDNRDDAKKLVNDIARLMAEGGFHFRKWVASEDSVLQDIPDDHRVKLSQDATVKTMNKALGVQWHPVSDTIHFNGHGQSDSEDKMPKQRVTKRRLASETAAVFDPIGLLSPFSIIPKRLIQRLWKHHKNVDWDDVVPDDIEEAFTDWSGQLTSLANLQFPRSVKDTNKEVKAHQLHAFGDASPHAYAAALYLRTEYKDGTTSSRIVCAKTKVAPADELTLPRLELMASVIAARLADNFIRNIGYKVPVTYWSDSEITLYWLNKPSGSWKVFVANRVKEVQALSDGQPWRHIPGPQNPADLATRGISVEEMRNSTLWSQGPPWLLQDESNWPKNVTMKTASKVVADKEAKMVIMAYPADIEESDIQRLNKGCGTFTKMARVVAYMRRWTSRHRTSRGRPLSSDELNDAIRIILVNVQRHHYREEIEALETDQGIPKNSKLTKLVPFLDKDGILRVQGRMQFANTSYEEKHPAILPSTSGITHKLIMKVHYEQLHAGPEWTLFYLRKKFYILKGRRTIKEVINKCCVSCQRWKNKALKQVMAPLPPRRIQTSQAFQHVGLDFAGPVHLLQGGIEVKGWILLLTCFSSRAIHLELVLDMSTPTFIQALRRFFARRGLCTSIYSDNAKTFKCANKELISLWKIVNKMVKDPNLIEQGIEWSYIVEGSPWWGGLYERLVRSIKEPIRRTIGNAKLDVWQFYTLLTEVEALVNSRPLTIVSANAEDPLPITPAKLLTGQDLKTMPTLPRPTKVEETKQSIIVQWKARMALTTAFWNSWKKDYLLELTRVSKWNMPGKQTMTIQPGVAVLVSNDQDKRNKWPMGVIIEVFKGRDGLPRSAVIKTATGQLRRPVQRLIPMELDLMNVDA